MVAGEYFSDKFLTTKIRKCITTLEAHLSSFLSIRNKIIFSFLLLIVLMGAVFAATSYFRIIRTMHHEIEKRGIEVSKTFSQMVTPYIFDSDYVAIIDNSNELIDNSDIRKVAIIDSQGKIWLSTQAKDPAVSTKDPFYGDIIKNKRINFRHIAGDGHKSLEIVTPIMALGQVAYLLNIKISLDSIEKQAGSRIREAMTISALMTVLAILFGALVAGLVLGPLHSLVQGTNEIARGNFSHRIAVTSNDELGELSKSFNLMAGNLEQELSARKQIEENLQEHQEHLERTVLARTSELRQTNIKISEEINQHKHTEKALRESEERYKRFSEVTIDGIVFHNQEGIFDINETFTQIFGYGDTELQGKTLIDSLRLPNDIDVTSNSFIETVAVRKDGKPIHIEMLSRVLEDHNNLLLVTSLRNITDRKLLETRLYQAQKMESIGLIAGGVAHDLNNILTGIVGYPELLLMDLPEASPLRRPLEMIKDSGLRASAVVSDLLTIARGAVSVRELENLNHLINEYIRSPEHARIARKHPGITIETHFQTDLWNMYCSPVHVRKSIMNLISNAVEAIGERGKIVVATTNENVEQQGDVKQRDGKQSLKKGEYVVMRVSDSGAGIADEDKQHIFEPFFSRKKMGSTSGSGLGLTVVWNTAQDHEGAVFVAKNDPGTIFCIYFPATRQDIELRPVAGKLKDLCGHGERLLIVDDDERQQIICSQILKTLGYNVDVVASGEEALEYLKTNLVDLLLLDMILGSGMNGRQTYVGVQKMLPGLKTIIVSGFSADAEVKKAQRLGAGRFVKKPYTIVQIGMAIKEALTPSELVCPP